MQRTSAPIRSARDEMQWLLEQAPGGELLVLTHNDADGLSAGAVLSRALTSTGREVGVRLIGRFEDAWSNTVRDEIERRGPAGLLVADLGVRPAPIVPALPTLLIDHHVPRGGPSDPATHVVSGYGTVPAPSSSVLAWSCMDQPASLAWVAALGAIGDFGEKVSAAAFPALMTQATSTASLSALRAASALINAPRRASHGDAAAALSLLLRADRAGDITSGIHPETAELELARTEVAEEVTRTRRVAPQFAGRVALLRVHSRCQVHPLVAQSWVARLKTHIVIAANTGFRDGYVHFAARTATGTNLITFLREHAPAGGAAGEAYGGGHEQASGGALTEAVWAEFVEGLGFQ